MPEHLIEVPHGRLCVADDGTGPPIVLVHAGIAQLESWDGLVAPLTAAGFRAIRPDLRGFGGSDTEDVPYTHHDDLVAVLDDLGISQAVLVGNSMGGAACFDLAIARPDRVVAVVGVGAAMSGYDGLASGQAESDLEHELFAEMEALEAAEPVDPDAVADLDVRVWVDGPGQSSGRVAQSIREQVRAWDRALNAPGRVRGRRSGLEPPAAARLHELTGPVLAIAGALDVSDVTALAHHLAASAPNARAIVWDDVAHMIGMEVPQRLAGEILAFVEPLRPWS